MSSGCAACAYLRGEGAYAHYPRRDVGEFVVHAKLDTAATAGWLVITPKRHVEAVSALTDDEMQALGPLIKRCVHALERTTPTAKAYVASFNEALPHVHLHVIARPPEMPPLGPKIFSPTTTVPPATLCTTVEAALQSLESGDRSS